MGIFLDHIKKNHISFSSLLPEPMGSALDLHFEKRGWELQAWDTGNAQGYQIYFGAGVQVDNYYEYGFPYLYDKEELLAFAKAFYESRVCEVNIPRTTEIQILSVQECTDEAYGSTLVQYRLGDTVSFCFSDIPFSEALFEPDRLIAEMVEQSLSRTEIPCWASLSNRLLEVVLENPFDMHFVEYDDDGWTKDICDKLFEEINNLDLYGSVTVGEDDALVTVYAGAMGSIDWKGHPFYGKPCLEHILDVQFEKAFIENRDSLEGKIQTANAQKNCLDVNDMREEAEIRKLEAVNRTHLSER